MSQKLEEARLLAVYRSIRSFGEPGLIDVSDLGDAYQALVIIGDLDKKEKEWDQEKLNVFVDGFITGLAASRIGDAVAPAYTDEHVDHMMYEPRPDETVAGGASGGVVAGQVTGDPDYVTQTGKV